ncbi:MAG: hypothetical protein ACFWUJ_08675 [Pseudomonas fragi]
MTDLTRTHDSWLTSASHQQWLRDQGQALVDFAKAAACHQASPNSTGMAAERTMHPPTPSPRRAWSTVLPSPTFKACLDARR